MQNTFVVTDEEQGMRLDQFLAARLPSWSRARLQQLIEQGAVRIDDMPARKSSRVTPGAAVCAECDAEPAREHSPARGEAIALDILYEDDLVIAVNKPAGLVVHPGSGNRTGTLVNALLHYTEQLSAGGAPDRPGIVHRLDKDTSGIILVARTNRAHAALSRQFADRKVSKAYYGFCVGHRPPPSGSIDGPVARSRREPEKFCVASRGRQAVTCYRCLAWRDGIGFVEFRPRTGRTHQIRVHAASANMPILADTVYGGGHDAILRLEPLQRPFANRVSKCFTRQALHAYTLSFTHPGDGRVMNLTAPFPDDFRQAIGAFGAEIDISVPGTFESGETGGQ